MTRFLNQESTWSSSAAYAPTPNTERASNRSEAGVLHYERIHYTFSGVILLNTRRLQFGIVHQPKDENPTCRLQILWSPLLEDQLGSDTLDSNSVPELYANLYRFFSFVAPKLRSRRLYEHLLPRFSNTASV